MFERTVISIQKIITVLIKFTVETLFKNTF